MKKQRLYSELRRLRMEENYYIHIGARKFNPELIDKIENTEGFSKPINGGYWGSPVDSPKSWIHLFGTGNARYTLEFKLKKEAKVLKLLCESDLENLPRVIEDDYNRQCPVLLDFVEISKQYDAILCDASPGSQLNKILVHWDCLCILVLNTDVIEVVSETENRFV